MTNPTTPFSWQMPTSTDLVTDLPADFETFGQAVATSMADLLGGTTGQVLSKASNTDMDFTWVAQDDSNAIQNAIVDAKGDLITATAADTPARLAVGTNGQTLVADSSTATGLKWATASSSPTFVGCRLTGSDQSIPNNTQTAILWSTETFDTDGFHSTSSNTSRITIPAGKAGYYQLHFCAEYLASTAGNRYFEFRKNNTAFNVVSYVATGTTTSAPMTDIVNLAVGDYIEVFELQTSGGALTLYTSSPYGWFEATYLGA